MAVRIGKAAPEFEGEAWTRGARARSKEGWAVTASWQVGCSLLLSARFYIYLPDGNCILWRDAKRL